MANRVIARFRDGRMLKGTTINFRPELPHCHVTPLDQPYGEGVRVDFKDLKALFFVRDLRGNPQYKDRKEFVHPPGYGRRVRVEFGDGEEMFGVVHAIDRRNAGFFLFPSDPASNNERVFAIHEFVRAIDDVAPEDAAESASEPAPQPQPLPEVPRLGS